MRYMRAMVAAFSLDVKAAHKSIRVLPSERGLLGIRVGNKLHFYKVCPFGASFSAYWFGRLGAFLVRVMHFIYVPHFLALYVDDLLGSKTRQLQRCRFAFCSVSAVHLASRCHGRSCNAVSNCAG